MAVCAADGAAEWDEIRGRLLIKHAGVIAAFKQAMDS